MRLRAGRLVEQSSNDAIEFLMHARTDRAAGAFQAAIVVQQLLNGAPGPNVASGLVSRIPPPAHRSAARRSLNTACSQGAKPQQVRDGGDAGALRKSRSCNLTRRSQT